MLYIALGLSISLTNLSSPINCMFQIFSWRKADETMLSENNDKDQVPKTVAEMRELIAELKENK